MSNSKTTASTPTWDQICAIVVPANTKIVTRQHIAESAADDAPTWSGNVSHDISGLTVGNVVDHAIKQFKITWASNARKRVAEIRREKTPSHRVVVIGTHVVRPPVDVVALAENHIAEMSDDELDAMMAKRTAARAARETTTA